jgi:hypothetical protein
MTLQDYEYLLVAANLAHYHPKWGFNILVDRLKMFLEGHHFYKLNGTGSLKVDSKKADLNACILGVPQKLVKVHVICIGQSTDLVEGV